MDVASLYTSIPHELGLEAINFWSHKHRLKISSRFSNAFILDSIEFILKNNYFHFEDDIYLQNSGTAMGTAMAPTYANLVMGYLENKMYQTIANYYEPNISAKISDNWLRYIDDCFIIWDTKFGNLNNFLS